MSDAGEIVLLVDDEPGIGVVLRALLAQDGIASHAVTSGAAALAALAERPYDVVVTDLKMPGMDGLALLTEVGRRWPEVPVILLTAHGTVAVAVEAMKAGAADFLEKPFDPEGVRYVVRKALTVARHAHARPPAAQPGGFVGDSAPMREVFERLRAVARSQATVLIRGESGTGKELAARALHEASPRCEGPFVALHCGALPDALLESELFGYEKGAFTGATARKPGRVELAHGGTLFLDEIGDVSAAVQLKLLRVLQEKRYERLGGTQTLTADVRFVAATHRDLAEMVKRAEFREDLYYRLNVVPIWMPPLRERPGDIDALARHFCAALGAANGRPEVTLDAGAIEALRRAPWPGNVRQLQNFIERLVVLTSGERITAADVARELTARGELGFEATPSERGAAPDGPLDARMRETEREALVAALDRAGGNRTLAAKMLGVGRRTLYTKLKEHGIS